MSDVIDTTLSTLNIANIVAAQASANLESHLTNTADIVAQLNHSVYNNTLFRDALPYELYPTEYRQDSMSLEDYEAVRSVIDPVIDFVAESAGYTDDQRETFRLKVAGIVIPKSLGLAANVLKSLGIPEDDSRLIIPAQTAAKVYMVDVLVDGGFMTQDIIQSLMLAVRPANERPTNIISAVSFDDIFATDAFTPEQEKRLRQIAIEETIIMPAMLQSGKLETSHALIARIKMNGSGYDISTWTCLYLLENMGIVKDAETIMANPVFDQIRKMGAVMTRLADDLGDVMDDIDQNQVNTVDPTQRAAFLKEFCLLCDLDSNNAPTQLPEQSDKDYNMCVLHFFINQMKEKVMDMATKPGVTSDEDYVLKVLVRSAVICYENLVGDQNMIS